MVWVGGCESMTVNSLSLSHTLGVIRVCVVGMAVCVAVVIVVTVVVAVSMSESIAAKEDEEGKKEGRLRIK